MIETIKLGENITIYRKNIIEVDNEQLSKELWYSVEISQHVNYPNPEAPGIQSNVLVTSKNVNIVRENMVKCMFYLVDKPYFYITNEWIFISKNDNVYSEFHRHNSKSSTTYIKQKPDYTLTYYTKMPDKLNGDDGCLIFKDETGEEFSVLPKEGDLLIFDANLLHRASTNTHSNTERIVFCCNFHFLDINKKYLKIDSTLI
jgi:predicted 2-oxoglutarate/Fe(II)-dependent dioxygenase YbiX